MKQQFKDFGGKAKLAFAGLAAATAAYFQHFRQEMDRLAKLADRFDASPDEMRRLGLAADLAGTDVETLAKGMQTLNRNAIMAREGSESMERALNRVGLTAEDLIGLSIPDQFMKLADAVEQTDNKADALASTQELMGRAGAEAFVLMKKGADAVSEAMGPANDKVNEMARRMEELNDRQRKAGESFKLHFGSAMMDGIDAIAAGYLRILGILSKFVPQLRAANEAVKATGINTRGADAFTRPQEFSTPETRREWELGERLTKQGEKVDKLLENLDSTWRAEMDLYEQMREELRALGRANYEDSLQRYSP